MTRRLQNDECAAKDDKPYIEVMPGMYVYKDAVRGTTLTPAEALEASQHPPERALNLLAGLPATAKKTPTKLSYGFGRVSGYDDVYSRADSRKRPKKAGGRWNRKKNWE